MPIGSDEWVRYTVSGITRGYRNVIMHENDLPTSDELQTHVVVNRDYDSLIGHITSPDSVQLPYTCAVAVFPIPRYKDTLKSDNHLTTQIATVGGL